MAEGTSWRFLGIFSKNREEWAITDLACMRNSVTIVPFFDSLGPDALAFVINQTELTTMCIEKNQFEQLLKLKQQRTPSLKNLVLFGEATEEQREKAKAAGLNLYDMQEVMEHGKAHPEVVLRDPTSDSVYMFCYTSGTTGDPKGAKMTHEMFLSCEGLTSYSRMEFRENDCSISYLPMAHIFEQFTFFCSLAYGFSHGYYGGDALKLLDDIAVLKPTFMATVPRILNRVHGKIIDGVNQSGGFKKWIFDKAIRDKLHYLETQNSLTHSTYDRLFGKVRDIFGGNLRVLVTASAPIAGDVLQFFKVTLGIHIYEVYGQTETCGPATFTHPGDPTAGHVGGCFPGFKVRLRDVPEMGYLATDEPPRGEIQFKGKNVFKGYFKNPEKT